MCPNDAIISSTSFINRRQRLDNLVVIECSVRKRHAQHHLGSGLPHWHTLDLLSSRALTSCCAGARLVREPANPAGSCLLGHALGALFRPGHYLRTRYTTLSPTPNTMCSPLSKLTCATVEPWWGVALAW